MAVYARKSTLARRHDICITTVDDRIRRIRALIGTRYPVNSIEQSSRFIRVRTDVFDDMMLYGDAIQCGVAPAFKGDDKQ